MTNIDTAAARRAWEETTQGEWRVEEDTTSQVNGFPDIYAGDTCIIGTEGFYTEWAQDWANARFIARAHREYPALLDEIERLRGELAKANGAQWFYLGDDCGSDQCRFSIDECIDEDFLHYNRAEGSHVVLISGARPVPDMWLALKFFTEEEKDEREDDEPYTFTIHGSEEAARTALGEKA